MTDHATGEALLFEQLLDQYFTHHLPPLLCRAWLKSALRTIMAIDDVRDFLETMKDITDFAAVDTIIARLGLAVRYENIARIPSRGRLLVVANHPLGAADVFLLLQCLHHVRSDVRVVINKLGPLLVPPIRNLCLPVDRYSRFDPQARALISSALGQEQAVIIFPAGGISKLTLRGVRDHHWKHGVVHFARECQADLLPVYIVGRSSRLFLSLPRKIRHFLVAREMLYPPAQSIIVRIGACIPYSCIAHGEIRAITQQLQHTVYALAHVRETS